MVEPVAPAQDPSSTPLRTPIEKPHRIREQQDLPYTELVGEDLKRAWLAHYGAPLYGESMLSGRAAPDLEKLVVDALALGRRDPSLTRALPVLLWRRRGDLDMAKLRRLARGMGRERTLGFFLDLAGRRMQGPVTSDRGQARISGSVTRAWAPGVYFARLPSSRVGAARIVVIR